MDWQQVVSLLIVAAAAVLLARGWWRRRRRRVGSGAGCGCSAANPDAPSIIFHARKGERPEIHVKSASSKADRG
ncbi:MAG: hypothetical protein N3I86_16170 [Verrucomicrobiae bacterium]|nr:hypothetical protein [Verrucomicrobiae bacterium]